MDLGGLDPRIPKWFKCPLRSSGLANLLELRGANNMQYHELKPMGAQYHVPQNHHYLTTSNLTIIAS